MLAQLLQTAPACNADTAPRNGRGVCIVANQFPRQRRCACVSIAHPGVGSLQTTKEHALMRQKLIVQAVCLALAMPAGMAVAGPLGKNKPDTLLAVDMNRTAIIDGVVANWKAELTATQEKVLRATLSTLRADRLMAASLASSFDGVVAVMKTVDHAAPLSEKVNEKAAGGPDLVYVPITPCRIVDTRNVGGPISAGNQANFFYYSDTAGFSWSTQGGD